MLFSGTQQASKMRGFVDPFVPAPAWPPQDNNVLAGSPWTGCGGGSASSLADAAGAYLAAAPDDQGAGFRLDSGSSPALLLDERFLNAQQLQDEGVAARGIDSFQHVDGGGALLAGALLQGTPTHCAMSSLADDSAPDPVVCSSNDSSGSDRSVLPQFLLGEPAPPPAAAWPPTAFAQISSLVGEETSQGFGFGAGTKDDLLLEACRADGNKYPQQHDDLEFNTGKMLSFAPAPGQQVNTTNFSHLQEPSGLHHLNLSSLVSGQLSSFSAAGAGAAHNPKQSSEVSSGKIGLSAPPFGARSSEVPNGSGVAASGAPKPRVRARRGQATDPHSIAERLRREKISDRMKNLQELVPNSNRTDKASMLDEIIDYVKFLQLQVKVLSMSRLGATEAVVPLLTESHSKTESSGGLLLSPRSEGRQQAAAVLGQPEPRDGGAAFEQEVVQLMENNMTTAMQYLQSKGLCLMPIALASAISDQKGASSAAVRPGPEDGAGEAADDGAGGEKRDAKEMMRALVPLGGPREMRSRA
ncbi:hypothetical protein BS78_04G167600 [Paspalum vaginatum]|nr:hypothetical protein BS78_04G167600 [Paspalum vaginatum]KAJ1279612.1 hypothetical protein BS78_04G167600 [Paspalum vaginatum]